MGTGVIVLNGASSAGKTELARALQAVLPEPWLTFGIDSLIEAMPRAMLTSEAGIAFSPDGQVSPGAVFRELERAWMHGIAATVRAGARIIIDDVFLGGTESQRRWRTALQDLQVLWVGVRCDIAVAEAREQSRGGRVVGMARSQSLIVHEGVDYDLQVDTTATAAMVCAREIAAHVIR